MSFDDYFFTRPSFVGGVARVIDLGGVLGREAVLSSRTPQEADERALASDFRVVGKDLEAAMNVVAPDATE
jgi:hypothetical protein